MWVGYSKGGGEAEGYNKNTRQGIAISETKTFKRQGGGGNKNIKQRTRKTQFLTSLLLL